ncbi:MAG: sulfatase [Pirellulaceae bacterium]|nr:sulfatase [Pirellulaceae bacterium]
MLHRFLLLLLPLLTTFTASAQQPNVLFIAVDDLRPQLGCYGKTFMTTPHFDALAKRSVLFERAYCMVPTCGASRASLMTSLRPHPRRFVTYTARADKEAPHAKTLNTVFKQNGYTTISLGKVFHNPDDNTDGWSQPPWRPKGDDYSSPATVRAAIRQHRSDHPQHKREMRGPAYESADQPDDAYRDHQTTTQAIGYLNDFSTKRNEPFFLAVGFMKPHLPFCAPKKYWDLYDYDQIDVPANFDRPSDVPDDAVHTSGELRAYAGIPPTGQVDRETARHLIHGYYACVSFIDAQIGRLLRTLDQSGLGNNTIIVLWGDHGWQLGEHSMWNKHSCFETSMLTPLMISAPGITGGTKATGLTEFIDIYPTLCDLARIEIPDHVEGKSLLPLLRDPSQPGKPFAIGRYRSGDTIRSDQFRFSQYRGNRGLGSVSGTMLFNHRQDPDENQNVVANPVNESTVELLARELHARKGKNAAAKSN